MKSDLHFSLRGVKSSMSHFFKRFHFVIFFVTSVGGLAACIFLLNGVIVMSDQPNGYTSSTNDTSFDTVTVERLRKLKQAGQSTDKLDLSGRINPFAE